MNLNQFSDWLSSTSFSQLIQTTSWAIPAIQTVHIICLAVLFACALVFFPAHRRTWTGVRAVTHAGCPLHARDLVAAGHIAGDRHAAHHCGTRTHHYQPGVLHEDGIARGGDRGDPLLSVVARRQFERPSGVHVFMAGVGMLLWVGIMFAGRLIAYVEAY